MRTSPLHVSNDLPTSAQFLVLGMRSVSLSTFQPQWWLSVASQIRYMEYALMLLPSPPRFRDSTNSSIGVETWNAVQLDRSKRESKVHEQQGIERYPEAEQSVESNGTHGVSSSAWFPIMKTPGCKYELVASASVNDVGSRASTCRWACVLTG